MPNSVNQTSGGLFGMDMPVMKQLPPEPSESFDSAMKKAQPQPQPTDQQDSSQKTSQSNSKQETNKTSKSTKGKQTHKKSDRVDEKDDQEEQDTEQAKAVAAADAAGEDSTDSGKQQGDKKKDPKELAAAGKASKTDPLLQALVMPTKTISAKDASKVEKDDEAAESTAKATQLKTPVQKKVVATAGKATTTATKKTQAADAADDTEQLQDADDAVDQADDADAGQQVAGKQAKTKGSDLDADNDANQPALGADLKAPTAQTDQLAAQQQQQQAADDAATAAAAVASALPTLSDSTTAPSDPGASSVTSIDHLTALATDLTSATAVQGKAATTSTAVTQTAKPDAATIAAQAFTPPEVQFADSNHAKIVSGIQGQLMPNGGTMQIRLDPPELGALQVSIHMKDGVVNATFQTSNDDATKVLSHSLSQLKQALETQGISVDKLHVQQAPRDHQTSNDDQQQKNQDPSEQSQQKQEQQRRELLQRMWKRLTNGSDPLDMVA